MRYPATTSSLNAHSFINMVDLFDGYAWLRNDVVLMLAMKACVGALDYARGYDITHRQLPSNRSLQLSICLL